MDCNQAHEELLAAMLDYRKSFEEAVQALVKEAESANNHDGYDGF